MLLGVLDNQPGRRDIVVLNAGAALFALPRQFAGQWHCSGASSSVGWWRRHAAIGRFDPTTGAGCARGVEPHRGKTSSMQ
jgi:hypothetical protein